MGFSGRGVYSGAGAAGVAADASSRALRGKYCTRGVEEMGLKKASSSYNGITTDSFRFCHCCRGVCVFPALCGDYDGE